MALSVVDLEKAEEGPGEQKGDTLVVALELMSERERRERGEREERERRERRKRREEREKD